MLCCPPPHRGRRDRETDGPDPHNLVTAIAAETGQDEEAALRAAAARFNDGLAAYAERDAALARTRDGSVHAFLATRRNWIRATYDWRSPRPGTAESQTAGKRADETGRPTRVTAAH
ncbi:hypothetical protein GA0070624_5846 [Micromonospora rhizosphaerae]|uniref:Uncharacterized protein n=1 Tax=Micromonospora rhizosphaerae TaxID=568872 RepID=A0A1C6T721_9ACTN|nr:hypothetical protein [Micromonospora rhizosphaerae]SCL37362.1 hypothetical protein GA0070624_5846 [Micromonospora rhizosphaerae]